MTSPQRDARSACRRCGSTGHFDQKSLERGQYAQKVVTQTKEYGINVS
jgi:hypothetical protein